MKIITEQGHVFHPYFPPMPLATALCKGTGIELGASAHNSFGIEGALNCAPYGPGEEDDFELYRGEQIRLSGGYSDIEIPGEAHDIPVEDASMNYVISSHVAEHLPNLILCFKEWDRVLKYGGVIFTIIPKRDALPSDAGRAITPLSHFIDDMEANATPDDHIDPEGNTQPRRGHYHVFTLASFKELVDWCNFQRLFRWEFVAEEETDSKVGNGHTVVYRKHDGKDDSTGDLLAYFDSIGRYDLSQGDAWDAEKFPLKWEVVSASIRPDIPADLLQPAKEEPKPKPAPAKRPYTKRTTKK